MQRVSLRGAGRVASCQPSRASFFWCGQSLANVCAEPFVLINPLTTEHVGGFHLQFLFFRLCGMMVPMHTSHNVNPGLGHHLQIVTIRYFKGYTPHYGKHPKDL